MSKSKIWEAIANASARELFDFALTLEANFAIQRAATGSETPTDISDGELAAFLFETADDQAGPNTSNLVEIKQ